MYQDMPAAKRAIASRYQEIGVKPIAVFMDSAMMPNIAKIRPRVQQVPPKIDHIPDILRALSPLDQLSNMDITPFHFK
jgi:hypothetical protein